MKPGPKPSPKLMIMRHIAAAAIEAAIITSSECVEPANIPHKHLFCFFFFLLLLYYNQPWMDEWREGRLISMREKMGKIREEKNQYLYYTNSSY